MDLLRSLLRDSLPTPALPPVHLQNAGHLEIAELVSKFQALQKASKKLLEDSKKYSKSVKDVSSLEVKLLSNLQNVGSFRDDEVIKEVVDGHQCIANFAVRETCDLERVINETVSEPLRKYQKVFSALSERLRIREDQVNNIIKTHEKLKKLQRSDSTSKWKIAPSAMQLERLEADFVRNEKVLLDELKSLYGLRLNYFAPVLQSLSWAQVSFHGDHTKKFCEISDGFKCGQTATIAMSNKGFQEYLNSKMERLLHLRSTRFGDAR